MNKLICVLTVILYVGLATNVGFAQESVKTELKEAATPRPPTEPTPPPQPIVLDNETIMKVKEFLAEKFNKSVDEIEIEKIELEWTDKVRVWANLGIFSVTFADGSPQTLEIILNSETKAIIIDHLSKEFNKTTEEIKILNAGKTYEKDRIFIRTNVGEFTYKDEAIYPTGLRLESKFSTEEATHILKSKLADEGVDIDSAVFYGRGNRIFNESLCHTNYERGSDLNYYPNTQICDFYFLKSIDEKKAIYEYWGFTFDAETGEIYRQEKEGPAVFKSVKTREDAVRVLKEKMNISVDPSKVFLNPNPDGWHYIIPLNEAVGLRLYDDGTIKQLRWDVISERSSSPGIRVGERSKSPFIFQIAMGLLLILVIIGGYFVLKKRGN